MPEKKSKLSKAEKELQETLIQVGLKIAKRGEGALFVVGKAKYKPLVNQTVLPFKVTENPKLLESLAIMDGAVIIDKDGNPLSVNYQQPSGDGIYGCAIVPCPKKYPDSTVCWCCCNYD